MAANPVVVSPDLKKANASPASVLQTRGNRQIRVAHAATRLIIAGMGQIIASLVRGIPSDRYHSAIWCLEEADILGEQLRAEGHEVIEFGKRKRRDFSLFMQIASRLRKERIEILHCHDELSWFYGTIAAMLCGDTRVIVTMHGRRPDISLRHLIEQRVLAFGTARIIAVSSYLRRQLVKEINVSKEKAITIRNGIESSLPQDGSERLRYAREALALPSGAIVVGSVGRLAKVKNINLLLNAVALARGIVPCLHLVLIGEGPCYAELVREVNSLDLNEAVTFTGLRKDVEELLAAFDLYVCSSDYEGISLSILEAMAARRAVIATAVGGNTEIICHNETGILVEKGDRQALARSIVELSRDARRRHRLGQQARRTVLANYSIARMIQNYDGLYHTVLGIRQYEVGGEKQRRVS